MNIAKNIRLSGFIMALLSLYLYENVYGNVHFFDIPLVGHGNFDYYTKFSIKNVTASKAFDVNSKKSTLGNYLFGAPQLQDIFLASKMSNMGLFTLPPGSPFGGTRLEQYLACLAPTELTFNAESTAKIVTGEFLYNFKTIYLKNKNIIFRTRASFSYVEKIHRLFIKISNGSLQCNTPPSIVNSNINQFYTYFNADFSDFLNRAVLEPKGIEYKPLNSKSGFGDGLFSLVMDVVPHNHTIRDIQWGINLGVPLSKTTQRSTLWQPCTSDYQNINIGLFGQIFTKTHLKTFNPLCFFQANFIPRHQEIFRMNSIKTHQDLKFIPSPFKTYTQQPFSLVDSVIPEFADQKSSCKLNPQASFFGTIGNAMNDIFFADLYLTLYYHFFFQTKAKITPLSQSEKFDVRTLKQQFSLQSHTVALHLTAYYNKQARFSIGLQKMISGKNTPDESSIYGTAEISF